ncbi:DUF4442 domain-containing protein [Stenotrophomonas pictorum]|uniref:DUF4442 domain-containing protein n=1 Tax=Stenotrophomonas pictorum TaxID=86184 RepID=UPI000B3157C9
MLEPGRCAGDAPTPPHQSPPIDTVHAIAMCSPAERMGWILLDANLPANMRWIPRGMEVKHLTKAQGLLKAVATPELPPASTAAGYALPARINVSDAAGMEVFQARTARWASPRKD